VLIAPREERKKKSYDLIKKRGKDGDANTGVCMTMNCRRRKKEERELRENPSYVGLSRWGGEGGREWLQKSKEDGEKSRRTG